MADLATTYMGMTLGCPIVASASPLLREVDAVRELEDGGIGAVVLFSLFQEQFTASTRGVNPPGSIGTFLQDEFLTRPHEYLEHVARIKRAVDVPIIASLNVATVGHWLDYLSHVQEAGVDGIELSLYRVVDDPYVGSASVEAGIVELLEEARARVSVPLAVKFGPFVTSLPWLARRLDETGADALVLFQRFCEPDIDIERQEFVTDLELSSPRESGLPLMGIFLLRGQVGAGLAVSGGIHDAATVVAVLMAGADVAMMCSALLERGTAYLGEVRRDLAEWLDRHGHGHVGEIRGVLRPMWEGEPPLCDKRIRDGIRRVGAAPEQVSRR